MRLRLHILHAFSTTDVLSNDTNVNDLGALTLTLKLNNAFLDFVTARGQSIQQNISCLIYFEDGNQTSINFANDIYREREQHRSNEKRI